MARKGLPETFKNIVKKYPEVWAAHEQLATACSEAGPLDRKTRELIKVGICLGAGLETATGRHAIMATEHGATVDDVWAPEDRSGLAMGSLRARGHEDNPQEEEISSPFRTRDGAQTN